MDTNDIVLIKLFLNRDVYEKYSDYVNREILEHETQQIFKAIEVYFSENKEINNIELNDFSSWFSHIIVPDAPQAKQKIYKNIFTAVQNTNPISAEKIILSYEIQKTRKEIEDLFSNGFEIESCKEILDNYEKAAKTVEKDDEAVISLDLATIAANIDRSKGLKWRLKCLNNAVGPLVTGDFGIIAAPVDCGKTTFGVSEATFMASQLIDKKILWMNNEEYDYKVARRIWQAALGQPWKIIEKYKDKAEQKLTKYFNGDKDRIIFLDIRNKSISDIKRYFKKYKPGLVIIDQIDHISCPKYKAWADYDRLKYLYSSIRILANEYCPVLAITQADATVSWLDRATQEMVYQKYITMKQLDGSKIGKAAAADLVITLSNNPQWPQIRYLHVAKNKLEGADPNARGIQTEINFRGEVSRYED